MKLTNADFREQSWLTRRNMLVATASAGIATAITPLQLSASSTKENTMTPKAFVYTEVAISVPFDQAPWKDISDTIRQQPGFISKTWLSGHSTQTLGGLYAFDSMENARRFVTEYFPTEPRAFGVAHTTRVFDAEASAAASRDIGSPYYGNAPTGRPGAFVYTEVQVSVPFDKAPWADRNPVLKQQTGLQNKTWLSGANTQTLGGFDCFDTLEHALDFAINDFPKTAAAMNAAMYTRVFDATVTEDASQYLNSPFYL